MEPQHQTQTGHVHCFMGIRFMPFTGHSIIPFIFLQHKSPRFHGGFYSFHTSQHPLAKRLLRLFMTSPAFARLWGMAAAAGKIIQRDNYDNTTAC